MTREPRPLAPDCVTTREWMERSAVEATIDEVRARQVEAHVSTCPHCQRELAGGHLAWIDPLLAEAEPAPPTDGEWQRMGERLALEPIGVTGRDTRTARAGAGSASPQSHLRSPKWRMAKWLAPAAAAVLIVVALFMIGDRPGAPTGPPGRDDDLAMEVEIFDADTAAQYMIITPEEPGQPVLIIVSEL